MQQKIIQDKELSDLVKQFSKYSGLKNHLHQKRPRTLAHISPLLSIEPTNNLIREHVITRKIIGTFRSDKGAEYYQYIALVIATWKLQTYIMNSKDYSPKNSA